MSRFVSVFMFLAAAVASAAAGSAHAQKQAPQSIQCWEDAKGARVCGDRLPPEEAKKERQFYDSRGRLIDIKDRQKTAEEIEADRLAKLKADEEKRLAQERTQYDAFLIQTYRTIKDLEYTRRDRVTTLDGRIKFGEKAVADNEALLRSLNDQAQAARKAGKEPDKKLVAQISQYEKSLAQNRQAVESLTAERAKTIAKFDADIARYKELKGEVKAGVRKP